MQGPHGVQVCREGPPPGAGGPHGVQACREGPPGCRVLTECRRAGRAPKVLGVPTGHRRAGRAPLGAGGPHGVQACREGPLGSGGPHGAQACREGPPTLGTHRACREVSWWKVSALISQMRLCWRPLGQR